MILKAGTYTFIDTPTITSAFNQDIECEFVEQVEDIGEAKYHCTKFVVDDENNLYLFCDYAYIAGERYDFNNNVYFYYGGAFEWNSHSVTVITDSEVADTFGTAFISNTNYNEVNPKPLAEITYNGETIAQLNAGETCTIKCGPTEDKEYKMLSDIIIKINS